MQDTRRDRTSSRVLYVRLPGLLAQAARGQRPQAASSPLAVADGRTVRDACPLALAQGVRVGMGVVQARRLCPMLLVVAREEVDARANSRRLWDALAHISPVVEPGDADDAYADITGLPPDDVQCDLRRAILSRFGLTPIIGVGVSRLAARACAECALPAECLAAATVNWLWPEDGAVVGRLQRLGLSSFGAVAAMPEESLRLHFGKVAPVLHRRAFGVDLTPVRALYPPPTVEVARRFDDAVDSRTRLDAALTRMSAEAERELRALGGVGKRVVLTVQTERASHREEWAVPAPVATAGDVRLAAGRLLSLMRLMAPVTEITLSIEDVSPPTARTPDLFALGPGHDPVALEAVRRRLAARFGLTTLTILGQWPRTTRQKRRSALRERWEGARA